MIKITGVPFDIDEFLLALMTIGKRSKPPD